ncbi:MFS transporter [Stagnihabitans tardus]|uniref:MFS transporter n=1 Tax=Stagnihabitans tardus TaxID=2699202 RepID=A0AAE4YE35_9RHOB|nr:MFS transporter [Stagnihabitans tardus]NBZ89972.1 MFS transporter [Stagnihabitans tardus]
MRSLFTILALWCAGLGAAAQFGKMSVGFQDLARAYGSGGVGIGLMVSVVGMVGLVFGTTAGLIVARVGARRAMLWALGLGALVSGVESLMPPYAAMMGLRVLEGVSHLAIVVVGPTAIAAAAPPARQGAAMTLWSSFFGLTYAILAWIGPGILAAHGIGGLFQLHALWLLGCALVLWWLMPRDLTLHGAAPEGLLAGHLAIYRSPFVAAPATGFVCYTVTYVAVLTLVPPAMGTQAELAAVAMPLVSIGLSLTLGVWLLGRITAVQQVQAGFALAVVSALGVWAFWGQAVVLAPALCLAGALGLVQGASFASIPQLNHSPQDRARAAGAIAQLGNLGTTTGTPLLAFLMQKAGVTGLALFLIGFSALGIALHALQARRRLRP